jgi:hypothetical protein
MARYAMVDTGCQHVINVIEWDGNDQPPTGVVPPAGITMVRDTDPPTAFVGGKYDGTNFLPPVIMEPAA